ncbi:MAG: hypothetical protein ABW166_06075 [Sedimenticola sp.]
MFRSNARRNSIYKMQGILQDARVEERRLIMLESRYHIAITHEHKKNLKKVLYLNDPKFITHIRETYIPESGSWYDFVVLAKNTATVFVDNISTDALHGHSAIASGGSVILAGEIRFGDNGSIIAWTNKSGHYMVGSHHTEFSALSRFNSNKEFCHNYLGMRIPCVSNIDRSPILPISKFQLFTSD